MKIAVLITRLGKTAVEAAVFLQKSLKFLHKHNNVKTLDL